jgi:hypothetical protein
MTYPLSTSLIILGESRKARPREGDLVTVTLFGGKRSDARLERVVSQTYFVKLIGLDIPEPYQIGDRLPLDRASIIDWE